MGQMIKAKTEDLIDMALDWAVAKAEYDIELELHAVCCGNGEWGGNPAEPPECCGVPVHEMYYCGFRWSPSTDWNQGGPLLERYIIDLSFTYGGPGFYVRHCDKSCDGDQQYGDTALIAVCRAVVFAKLGNVVSVPAELVQP